MDGLTGDGPFQKMISISKRPMNAVDRGDGGVAATDSSLVSKGSKKLYKEVLQEEDPDSDRFSLTFLTRCPKRKC
mgnify:CR=1 FL=1